MEVAAILAIILLDYADFALVRGWQQGGGSSTPHIA
jgi:hypothetical protein